MTDLLEHAIETTRGLSADLQDEAARILLAFAGRPDREVRLTPEDEAAIARSREESAAGQLASDEDMEEIWRRHCG